MSIRTQWLHACRTHNFDGLDTEITAPCVNVELKILANAVLTAHYPDSKGLSDLREHMLEKNFNPGYRKNGLVNLWDFIVAHDLALIELKDQQAAERIRRFVENYDDTLKLMLKHLSSEDKLRCVECFPFLEPKRKRNEDDSQNDSEATISMGSSKSSRTSEDDLSESEISSTTEEGS